MKGKKRTMTTYSYKFRPSEGDFAIMQNNEQIKTVPTVQDANNVIAQLEANLPANFKGFGDWGVPAFLKQRISYNENTRRQRA